VTVHEITHFGSIMATPSLAPLSKSIKTFQHEVRRLMGPGPSELHPRVTGALAAPAIGYLDPVFVRMMEELKDLLRYALQTQNPLTFPASGPGSVGMETCFVNAVAPGDKVIVARNGVFGGRMVENVQRAGGTAIVVDDEWGRPIDANKVADAFAAHPDARVLAFVHAETSTGVASDAAALAAIAQEHDALTIMDAVTSLAGTPVYVDAWGIDAVYSGSQKCLSCTPGLSPMSFSSRFVDHVKARARPVQSWFMDLNLVLGYWGATTRTYHHTAPTHGLFALHEALVVLAEEGLEASWARHRTHHHALALGLAELGLVFLVDTPFRLPQMNAVRVPEGVDEAAIRRRLLTEFKLELGAGLGPLAGKIWRIGLMGYGAREDNVRYCLRALDTAISQARGTLPSFAAEGAAAAAYRQAARGGGEHPG
jgi:alanine-glyoxylate transaminase/serine-glyoxylate transaminase/serine-pyruvate transaminase